MQLHLRKTKRKFLQEIRNAISCCGWASQNSN